jgi:hypothetical protein
MVFNSIPIFQRTKMLCPSLEEKKKEAAAEKSF